MFKTLLLAFVIGYYGPTVAWYLQAKTKDAFQLILWNDLSDLFGRLMAGAGVTFWTWIFLFVL